MNFQQIEAKWDQFKGEAKSKWAKLTDDDLKFVAGKQDVLVGKIVERYGVLKEHAQKDVDEWVDKLKTKIDSVGKPHDKS